MQISVTFRHLEPSDALRNYVSDRLNKFQRYLDGPVEAHVVLGMEKFRHLADVTIDRNGKIIKGREENTDMYAAIDLVMDKIDMQLKKLRDKLRPGKADRSRVATPAAAAAEGPEFPAVRRQRVEVPAMELADAMEMMKKGGEDLVVFTNTAGGELNILFRRQDGNLVLVEPELG